MMSEFSECITELEKIEKGKNEEEQIAAVLLVGNGGKAFCAGADIDLAKTLSPADGKLMSALMTDTTNRLSALKSVSIACIDGFAIGGGGELCTSTDLRCFSRQARVKFVQGTHSVSTGWGGGRRLGRIIPKNEALKLLIQRNEVNWEEALRIGLCDVVADEDESAGEAGLKYIRSVIVGNGERKPISPFVLTSLKAGLIARTPEEETEIFASTFEFNTIQKGDTMNKK
jgi:enoyl-CoA hydratase